MKKIISLILVLVLCATALISCSDEEPGADKIRIGYMAGPTGMGMAKLIHDNGGEAADGCQQLADTEIAPVEAVGAQTFDEGSAQAIPSHIA